MPLGPSLIDTEPDSPSLLPGILARPRRNELVDVNADIGRELERARVVREANRARRQAKASLLDVEAANAERERRIAQAQAVEESVALPEEQKKGIVQGVLDFIDLPAKHVARPIMGGALSAVFQVLPGEQAGEVALRQAMQRSSDLPWWKPDLAGPEALRQALKETKLPPGVYTGLEILFDPTTYIGPGIAVKAVKGAKAVLKGAKVASTPATRIGELMPLTQRVDQLLPDNAMRKVGERLSSVPVVKNVVGAINPSVASKTEVGRALIGHQQLIEDAEALTMAAITPLTSRKNPFTIRDGLAILPNGRKAPIQSVFERSKTEFKGVLTKEQQDFIDEYFAIDNEAKAYLTRKGVTLREVALAQDEEYFTRVAISKEGVERLRTGMSKSLGATPKFQKSRFYQTVEEGLQNGVDYLNDPIGTLAIRLRGLYRMVADKELADALKPLGETLSMRIDPALRAAAFAARQEQTVLRRADSILANAVLGKNVRAELAVLARHRPTLASQISLMFEQPAGKGRTAALRNIRRAVQADLDAATDKSKQVLADLASARRRALQPRAGEAYIQQPGLAGRIFPQEVADEVNRVFRDRANTYLKGISQANAVARQATTGFDFGGGMIQGFPLLVTNPIVWAKAQGIALASLFSPRVVEAYKFRRKGTFQRMARIGIPISRAEFVETELPALQRLGKRIADVLRLHPSVAFNAFGDVARAEMFEPLEQMALRASQAGNKRAMQELADFVSKMTGVATNAKLGILPSQAALERTLLFAPRYLRASVGLVADIAQGGLRGQLARQAVAKMMAGGLVMYYGMATLAGQEPKLNPTRGDFLTVEIGGNRVGFGSIWVAMARLMGEIYQQAEAGDANKLLSFDPQQSVLAQFTRYRASPIVGLGWDVATGRDALGRPVGNPLVEPSEWKGALGRFAPFWAQNFLEDEAPGQENNKFAQSASEVVGMRSFPTSVFSRRDLRRDEVAAASFGVPWDQLSRADQRLLEQQDPELGELSQQVRNWNLERGDELQKLRQEYIDAKQSFRDDYNEKVDIAAREWERGGGTGILFRKRVDALGEKLRTKYQELDGPNSRFTPVIAEFAESRERWAAEGLKPEDQLYDEFFTRVIAGNEEDGVPLTDAFGQYNFEEAERRVADIRSKYPTEVWERVQVRLSGGDIHPVLRELKDGRDLFRAYWEVGDNLAEQAGLTEAWKELKKYGATAVGDELRKQYPALALIESRQTKTRQAMRKASPALDAWLLKFGYTTTPMSREVKSLGEKRVQMADFDTLALPID